MNIVQVRFLEPLFICELSLLLVLSLVQGFFSSFSRSPPSLKPTFPKIPISLGQAGNECMWLILFQAFFRGISAATWIKDSYYSAKVQ